MKNVPVWSLSSGLLLMLGCSAPITPLLEAPRAGNSETIMRVAFGSCNNHQKSQAYWQEIGDYFNSAGGPGYPDVWVWGGDTVYADTQRYDVLKSAYATLNNDPAYQAFVAGCQRSDCQIVGTWDDHDFGDNNLVGELGANPPADSPFKDLTKAQRKTALVDFLGEPTRSAVAGREQVYAAYDFERSGVNIRLILLDLRYDRQEPGDDAKIMGQAQWQWLETNLMDRDVDLHLIVSSTQILRRESGKDTWGQYQEERDKLLTLIGQSHAQGILLMTGDIHAAEISRLGKQEADAYSIKYPLYEITASGLNRLRCLLSVFCSYGWDNAYREGFIAKKNFGEIDIARADDGRLLLQATLRSSESPQTEVLLRKNIEFAPR